MELRNLFSRSGDLAPGDTVEVLNDSGETVEAIYKGKGKHAGGRIGVTYTQGRYTGMGQYVQRLCGPGRRKQSRFRTTRMERDERSTRTDCCRCAFHAAGHRPGSFDQASSLW